MKPLVKFFAISHRISALTRSSLSVYESARRYSSASSRADDRRTPPGSSSGTPPMALSSNHLRNSSAWGQSRPSCSVMVRIPAPRARRLRLPSRPARGGGWTLDGALGCRRDGHGRRARWRELRAHQFGRYVATVLGGLPHEGQGPARMETAQRRRASILGVPRPAARVHGIRSGLRFGGRKRNKPRVSPSRFKNPRSCRHSTPQITMRSISSTVIVSAVRS